MLTLTKFFMSSYKRNNQNSRRKEQLKRKIAQMRMENINQYKQSSLKDTIKSVIEKDYNHDSFNLKHSLLTPKPAKKNNQIDLLKEFIGLKSKLTKENTLNIEVSEEKTSLTEEKELEPSPPTKEIKPEQPVRKKTEPEQEIFLNLETPYEKNFYNYCYVYPGIAGLIMALSVTLSILGADNIFIYASMALTVINFLVAAFFINEINSDFVGKKKWLFSLFHTFLNSVLGLVLNAGIFLFMLMQNALYDPGLIVVFMCITMLAGYNIRHLYYFLSPEGNYIIKSPYFQRFIRSSWLKHFLNPELNLIKAIKNIHSRSKKQIYININQLLDTDLARTLNHYKKINPQLIEMDSNDYKLAVEDIKQNIQNTARELSKLLLDITKELRASDIITQKQYDFFINYYNKPENIVIEFQTQAIDNCKDHNKSLLKTIFYDPIIDKKELLQATLTEMNNWIISSGHDIDHLITILKQPDAFEEKEFLQDAQ